MMTIQIITTPVLLANSFGVWAVMPGIVAGIQNVQERKIAA
jgi:hypothetical protein